MSQCRRIESAPSITGTSRTAGAWICWRLRAGWRRSCAAPRPILCKATGSSRQRELPNGSAVLVFNLGSELRVEDTAGKLHRFPQPTAFYSGPSDRYIVTETDGAQEGIVVELTLPGARRLLGRPLDELRDRMIALTDLLGPRAVEIIGRIIEAPSPAARLALLEAAIEARIADAGDRGTRDLECAWNLQHASGGQVPITELADAVGCSRKHLRCGSTGSSACRRNCWRASCASTGRCASCGSASLPAGPISPRNAALPIRRIWRANSSPSPAIRRPRCCGGACRRGRIYRLSAVTNLQDGRFARR